MQARRGGVSVGVLVNDVPSELENAISGITTKVLRGLTVESGERDTPSEAVSARRPVCIVPYAPTHIHPSNPTETPPRLACIPMSNSAGIQKPLTPTFDRGTANLPSRVVECPSEIPQDCRFLRMQDEVVAVPCLLPPSPVSLPSIADCAMSKHEVRQRSGSAKVRRMSSSLTRHPHQRRFRAQGGSK
jgi:hypothetical protein